MMRAACYTRTGPAREVLQIEEMPVPVPGPGEVLVRIEASGINPSDTKMRAGWRGATMAFDKVVPHSDGAGVIACIAASGSTTPPRCMTAPAPWAPLPNGARFLPNRPWI